MRRNLKRFYASRDLHFITCGAPPVIMGWGSEKGPTRQRAPAAAQENDPHDRDELLAAFETESHQEE